EPGEEPRGRGGDLLDGDLEGGIVGARRLLHPAHLAHVLERSRTDLLLGRGRLEVVKSSNVPAHGADCIAPLQVSVRPPSTTTTWPVANGARARKTTASAISSGDPCRASGV